ncbi:exodeoxyribonuclease I, putative [Microscilla marina ATCC 23134]|uniref:Exodeoxyribonuclease I, putative n=2 Tax=Microscilla marina TaxID=1027 RepID=A1ZTJ0_MICM2|nr:exodeoxyribonuclease I, putative [Microscilla marina ATCC 23134]
MFTNNFVLLLNFNPFIMIKNKNLVFYDTRSSGDNPVFDQILRADTYVTDHAFNLLETHHIEIKKRPDVVPSPEALIANNWLPSDLAKGSTEYEAMRHIHELFNTPHSYNVGYGNLNNDDLLVRFGFYRNGLTPYTHQWQRSCRRVDLRTIVTLYYLQAPNALVFSKNAAGKVSLELDDIAQANGLTVGKGATNAQTIMELAKLLHNANPMLWEQALGFFDKKEDQNRVKAAQGQIEGVNGALLVDAQLGADAGFQQPVHVLGQVGKDVHYVPLDDPDLSTLNTKNLESRFWVQKKKLTDEKLLLNWKHRDPAVFDAARGALIKRNAAFVANNPNLMQQLGEYVAGKSFAHRNNVDLDAQLYQGGFWATNEKRFFAEFHEAPNAQEKMQVVNTAPTQRTAAIGQRILYRNFVHDMGALGMTTDWQRFIADSVAPVSDLATLKDYKGGRKRSIERFLADAEALLNAGGLSQHQSSLLEAWVDVFAESSF